MQPQQLLQFLTPLFENLPDYCENGLQLEGDREIKRILLSVSLSEALIDHAVSHNFDAIFVHHGYFGKQTFKFQHTEARKLRKLCRAGISVFGYHLPLDAQPEFGHNAIISREIGLQNLQKQDCGFVGENVLKLSCEEITERLNKFYGEENYKISVSGSGKFIPKQIGNSLLWEAEKVPKSVFVCSGGSGSLAAGVYGRCQLFILGEVSEQHPLNCVENGLGLLVLGHWRSEQAGIWAMADKFKEIGLEAVYHAIENVV